MYFEKDDLYQVAMIGLINALNNYKENKNTKFSTYAYFYILGEVKKFIRESSVVKVSKDLSNLNSSIEKARNYLIQRLGREVSDFEIANFLEIDEKQIQDARMSNLFLKSLDYETEEDQELYDFIGYNDDNYNIDYILLNDEINKLDSMDKKIILERYREGLTQTEVSKKLGISQVKVSRLEKDILVRLRTRMM